MIFIVLNIFVLSLTSRCFLIDTHSEMFFLLCITWKQCLTLKFRCHSKKGLKQCLGGLKCRLSSPSLNRSLTAASSWKVLVLKLPIIPIPRSVGLLLSRKRKASRRKCLQRLVSTSSRGAQTPWRCAGLSVLSSAICGWQGRRLGGISDEVGGVCKVSATS